MAEEVVGTVVDKLSTAAINKLGSLLCVRRDMRYIRDQLGMMKAYLRRAEERQDTDPLAKTWVTHVRELAYDAEDCIDEFTFHLNQPTAHGLAGALQCCMRCLLTLKARCRIARQIQDIKSRVKNAKEMKFFNDLINNSQGVGPSSYIPTIPAPLDPRLPALFDEEAELVGIDSSKDTLIQLTTENEPHLSAIAVVGTGGLGKTTLVRKVYESVQLFQCRAWITVSKFQIEDILRDMILELQIIPPEQMESLRPAQLIGKLKDHLKDKRYLIVFDDIWTTSAWEQMKLALPDSRNGSRVVVTTRIETVANACRSAFRGGHVHKHNPLSPEQSWDLFSKRVFKSPRDGCPPDLKELSNAIVKRCGGMPLAIVTIAGLLASKPHKTREEWQRVHDGLGFELETNPDLKRLKEILNLSYNDLPYDLRPCFLYLSKYPEDYEIKRRHVVELWVAEGFARDAHDLSAQEVAERYFDEFISRNMIQPSKVSYDGKVKSCRIHDVMLEVIVSKSREQNLVSLLGEHGTASRTSEQKIRRLSAHEWIHLERTTLSHVRSITMFGCGVAPFVSPRLRLLDLENIWLEGPEVKWRGKLVHLRYVYIDSPQSMQIPESWGNLHELETLINRGRGALQLRRVTGLQRLRHLRGGVLILPNRGIANLKALQALGDVSCGAGQGQMIKDLGELTQLRHLSLRGIVPENMSCLPASLAKLNSCLRSLKIRAWSCRGQLASCLESVSPPPLRLQKLALDGQLKKLPSWVGSLKDVAKIILHDTELEDDAIEVLQNLPNLIHLKLLYNSYVGQHLCFGREGFPSLRILLLGGSKSVKSFRFEEGAMPNLWRLALGFCPWPSSISIQPSDKDHNVEFYGIEHLLGLKELHLDGAFICFEDILRQAMETHPNHPQVTLGRRLEIS